MTFRPAPLDSRSAGAVSTEPNRRMLSGESRDDRAPAQMLILPPRGELAVNKNGLTPPELRPRHYGATRRHLGPRPACGLVVPDGPSQEILLERVSRTFALTIPTLPEELRPVIGNAYLLCRIVDTVEDEPRLSPAQKEDFFQQFVHVVRGEADAEAFSAALGPLLSENTPPSAHDLIRQAAAVLAVTKSLSREHRAALDRCVGVMADGMAEFQRQSPSIGLADQTAMDRYCYHVAGIVGETLTEFFVMHVPELGSRKQEMMALGRSFGQGLQMTNILKDVWDDLDRGSCWLPRSVFLDAGFDLDELRARPSAPERQKHPGPAFEEGLDTLVATAHGHLANALTYTLHLPVRESGLRTFCGWTVAMALLTLRRIRRSQAYASNTRVKISRRTVRWAGLASRGAGRTDWSLRMAFRMAGRGLPFTPIPAEAGRFTTSSDGNRYVI